jgi:hypothetical protein
MVKLSAVGPMIRVFIGIDSKGRRVRTIRNIGPAGAISDGNWASLTSHNGIVRERIDGNGGERDLDNTFDVQKQLLIFDVSDDEKRVEVQMCGHVNSWKSSAASFCWTSYGVTVLAWAFSTIFALHPPQFLISWSALSSTPDSGTFSMPSRARARISRSSAQSLACTIASWS